MGLRYWCVVCTSLLIRTGFLLWVVYFAPVFLVGDYVTDYLPRAQHLARTGVFPSADDLPLDFYLRPPGYSLVLTPLVVAGLSSERVVVGARVYNLLADVFSLFCIALLVWELPLRFAAKLFIALAVVLQPWTASLLILPGPDSLVMLLWTFAVFGLVLRVLGRGLGWSGRNWVALLAGIAVGVTVLLRAEMVVLAWVFVFVWVGWSDGSKFARVRAFVLLAAPLILAIGLNMVYSNFVQGRWNIWAGGQSRFTDQGPMVWVRSWYGDELTKTNIGWYWYRGQHLSMDFVPSAAVEDPRSAAVVREVLMRSEASGALSQSDSEKLALLAAHNREQSPWDWYVGIPLSHAWLMWADAAVLPQWRSALHQINWRVPGALLWLLEATLLCGLVFSAFAWARTRDERTRYLVCSLVAVVGSRTALFAWTINMPESRYMLPVLPSLIGLAIVGWSWLLRGRRSGNPGGDGDSDACWDARCRPALPPAGGATGRGG